MALFSGGLLFRVLSFDFARRAGDSGVGGMWFCGAADLAAGIAAAFAAPVRAQDSGAAEEVAVKATTQDSGVLRTWGAAVLRPYGKERPKQEPPGCRRYKSTAKAVRLRWI